MTKAQYAVGITQISKVDRVIESRRRNMDLLNQLLSEIEELILPVGHGSEHGSHLHAVRLDTDRVSFSQPEFISHLKNTYKVGTAKHYPPVWSWEAFQDLGYTGEGCPIAAKACEQVFSTPVFPDSTEQDLTYLAWAIKQSLADLMN